MNKKISALAAAIVIILMSVTVWMSQRDEPTQHAVQGVEAVEENTTDDQATEEDIPEEFRDNLDQAFEDLDAVDL